MNNRSKRKVAGSHASLARKSSASSKIGILIAFEGNAFEQKRIEIKLPCTLSELVFEISDSLFAAVEELAFKAGIQFLPAKEILTDGQAAEKIPF